MWLRREQARPFLKHEGYHVKTLCLLMYVPFLSRTWQSSRILTPIVQRRKQTL